MRPRKMALEPALQIKRLPDIENLPSAIFHEIDTRRHGQFLVFDFYLLWNHKQQRAVYSFYENKTPPVLLFAYSFELANNKNSDRGRRVLVFIVLDVSE